MPLLYSLLAGLLPFSSILIVLTLVDYATGVTGRKEGASAAKRFIELVLNWLESCGSDVTWHRSFLLPTPASLRGEADPAELSGASQRENKPKAAESPTGLLEGARYSFTDVRVVDYKYASYRITVTPREGTKWEVWRRMMEFVKLKSTLQHKATSVDLPQLPYSYRRSFDPDYLVKRRRRVQRFVECITDNPVLRATKEVEEFLSPSVALFGGLANEAGEEREVGGEGVGGEGLASPRKKLLSRHGRGGGGGGGGGGVASPPGKISSVADSRDYRDVEADEYSPNKGSGQASRKSMTFMKNAVLGGTRKIANKVTTKVPKSVSRLPTMMRRSATEGQVQGNVGDSESSRRKLFLRKGRQRQGSDEELEGDVVKGPGWSDARLNHGISVRAASHFEDGAECPAGPSACRLLGFEVLRWGRSSNGNSNSNSSSNGSGSGNRERGGSIHHVASKGQGAAQYILSGSSSNGQPRFVFIVNLQMPEAVAGTLASGVAREPLSLVCYWEMRLGLSMQPDAVPGMRQFLAQFYRYLDIPLSSFEPSPTPGDAGKESSGAANSNLTVVLKLLAAPPAVALTLSNAWGGSDTLRVTLSSPVGVRCYRGDNYIETDISMAEQLQALEPQQRAGAMGAMSLICDNIESISLEAGVLFAADQANELPEMLLGAVRLTKFSPRKAFQDVDPVGSD